MLLDHGIEISMDGRGRCHDNIFVERLWWTVKHEWVYLRPAAKASSRSAVSPSSSTGTTDVVRIRRSGWQTPDEAYFGKAVPDDGRGCLTRWRRDAVNLWTVGCADTRLTAQARSPMDKPRKTPCVSPTLPTGRRLSTSFTAPQQQQGLNLIPGKVKPSAGYRP